MPTRDPSPSDPRPPDALSASARHETTSAPSQRRSTLVRRSLAAATLLPLALLVVLIALSLDAPEPYLGPDQLLTSAPATSQPTAGPLRRGGANPRYFTDTNNHPVYLTGAHTWNNLQDIGLGDPPTPLDFERYLAWLQHHRHNFFRLWRWEITRWHAPGHVWRDGWIEASPNHVLTSSPHPWKRSGATLAFDGKPRFDLETFDDTYFDRLRTRVQQAGDRGIYVAIMLFEGWALRFAAADWKYHPFHPANNINGIDGDPNHDGQAAELFSGSIPAITQLQEAYIRHVIDTVNDLDNVLYEISNENRPESFAWQSHLVDFIRNYQRTKPNQHPVGLTTSGFGGEDDTPELFASRADWISPSPDRDDYRENPPPATGDKIILIDTDHLWGVGGDRQWVWKSFLSGLNPIFMDPYEGALLTGAVELELQFTSARRALGHTAWFAQHLDLAAATPQPQLASTGYCLAHPGSEYLVYLPFESHPLETKRGFRRAKTAIRNLRAHFARKVTVNLTADSGTFAVTWFNPASGETLPASPVTAGQSLTFTAPFKGDAVLHLRRTVLD